MSVQEADFLEDAGGDRAEHGLVILVHRAVLFYAVLLGLVLSSRMPAGIGPHNDLPGRHIDLDTVHLVVAVHVGYDCFYHNFLTSKLR